MSVMSHLHPAVLGDLEVVPGVSRVEEGQVADADPVEVGNQDVPKRRYGIS